MSKENNKGMNILQKIIKTIQTESRELTDAVMDSTGTGKLELAFDAANFKLKEAKNALTDMMKKEQQSLRILDVIKDKIAEQEQLVAEALSDDDHSQAIKQAQVVADLEHSLKLQTESSSSITANTVYLQKQLEQSERELKDFARQLAMLKTTENIQKATETIMNNIDGADANLLSAKKSLNRIRNKQKNKNQQYTSGKPQLKNDTKTKTNNLTLDKPDNNSTKTVDDIIRRIQDKSG